MIAPAMSSDESSTEVVQEEFRPLLPKVELHARIAFRDVKCPATRDERIAECVALGWKWFLALRRRGKDARRFPCAFASLVARAVRGGRRAAG